MNNTWRINDGTDKNWEKKGYAGDFRGTPQKSTPSKFTDKNSPAKSGYEESPMKPNKYIFSHSV
jgi:hypothetical protein